MRKLRRWILPLTIPLLMLGALAHAQEDEGDVSHSLPHPHGPKTRESLEGAQPRGRLQPEPPSLRRIEPNGAPAVSTGVVLTNPKPVTRKGATCEELRKNGRYLVFFAKPVDLADLVQTVANATCKTFILPSQFTGKISIIGPDNGKGDVDADQFYAAFLAALDANNLTVYPHGRFLKIIEKRTAKTSPIPTVGADDSAYTTNEQMVTKIFKLKYADVDPVRNAIQTLVNTGAGGESVAVPPDTLIVTDLADNVHRIESIINQLDLKSSTDELRVVHVRFATATEVASTIQKIFEQKAGKAVRSPPIMGMPPGMPRGDGSIIPPGGESSGPLTLTQIIPDERTNKLIIMASPAAFARIDSLIAQIDVPISGEGRINVYNLANANAEDMASTLQSLAQGSANKPRSGAGGGAIGGAPGGAPRTPGTTAELFAGEVKISADKATNALVIIASQNDYRNLARVIEKLDIPRRQVFVEAVIMEVTLDRKTQVGIALHQGFQLHTPEGDAPGVLGTSLTGGAPPSINLLGSIANLGGFLAGIQGPSVPALQALGVNIPSFGILLHALQSNSDVNVLSTPHLLTSDNEEAEITVGQNIPIQSGFSPQSLGGALPPGIPGGAAVTQALGGLQSQFAPITRQTVELKLSIKPQINDSDFVRLVINEQTEEIASADKVLGPSIAKRSAKTTVVAKDQETVVIGGIMQERVIESQSKVPLLGDLPILGHLFRDTTHQKIKTNLLLFLTPYIIRDPSDFRRIFERKMAERQQFVEEFYGQLPGYDTPIDFGRKAGPLQKMNQAVLREQAKAENGGPGLPGEQVIHPSGDPAAPSLSPNADSPAQPKP